MSGFALLFPGQGSQSVGMLDELLQSSATAREVFAEASETLQLDMLSLLKDETELNKTENTQPAMLCAGHAVWRCWQELAPPAPSCAAGHSLGEYTALCASGAISFPDALRLVARRGKLMAEHAPANCLMLAVIGLGQEQVEQCCRDQGDPGVSIANINSGKQIVLTGTEAAVNEAGRRCKDAGARKLAPLQVSVPAHSPLLAAAAESLADDLGRCSYSEPAFEVLHNIDAAPHPAGELPGLLARHVTSPVQWNGTMEKMSAMGVTKAIELGPGRVLSALCRGHGVKAMPAATTGQLQEALQFLEQEQGNYGYER